MSSHLLSPASPAAPSLADGFCGVVSVSEQGYERFEERDLVMILWLRDQLAAWASRDDGRKPPAPGAACHHLKGQGGIRKATQDLAAMLKSGAYPYLIRSDAKGYYAHIRHHHLIGLLREHGFSREVCHVTTRLCQRMTVKGGVYSECRQGIPLGCAASPLLAAIYLSPLDAAMTAIPGVRYLRYMDDWVVLCPTRWKMRKAVKLMHETLRGLGCGFIRKKRLSVDPPIPSTFSVSSLATAKTSLPARSRAPAWRRALPNIFPPQPGFMSRVGFTPWSRSGCICHIGRAGPTDVPP